MLVSDDDRGLQAFSGVAMVYKNVTGYGSLLMWLQL